ncbi:D-isomer specific 2-hydroxyacid dehydrogenase [Aspergillus alliaceus]|uniref:D-isomer specific 2-hydroxyacid dehydrogenase n=1 Tax=Petromyces alliaceus TaxID=209559 RepID=A0A5N7C7X8_PETAA|nr:D-isomer specific 2-hydroxyacid dehydrogenase [Aspergillus alliaceus]
MHAQPGMNINWVAGSFEVDHINHLPESCKTICHNGAGYDQIDVDACAKRGITVTYAPDLGNFKVLDFGHNPQGKILEQADPFGLITRYHNRRPLPAGQAAGAEHDSFERLLAESDIISINVPLNAHTRGLIGAGEIARIKGGVNVVNTARGVTIDEAAMAKALDLGKIAAVGLNVYELMVPHLGTHTVETLAKMETCATENARRVAVGEPLLTPVPKHIHSKRRTHHLPQEDVRDTERFRVEDE